MKNEESSDIEKSDSEPPVFKSTIPEFMLSNASPSERHILNALNCREQETAWAISRLSYLTRRVDPIDKFYKNMMSFKGVIALLFVALPVILEIFKLLGLLK